MKNPFAYIGIPLGLLIILWIYIEIRHRASKQRQRLAMKENLPDRVQERKFFPLSSLPCPPPPLAVNSSHNLTFKNSIAKIQIRILLSLINFKKNLEIQQQQKMERTIKAIANLNETQLGTGFDPNRQSWKIGKSQKYPLFFLLFVLSFDILSVVKLELQDLTLRTNTFLKEVLFVFIFVLIFI